jgi:hypothetical protein
MTKKVKNHFSRALVRLGASKPPRRDAWPGFPVKRSISDHFRVIQTVSDRNKNVKTAVSNFPIQRTHSARALVNCVRPITGYYGPIRPITAMCGKKLYGPSACPCRTLLSVLRVLRGSVVKFRWPITAIYRKTAGGGRLHQLASTCTNLQEKNCGDQRPTTRPGSGRLAWT